MNTSGGVLVSNCLSGREGIYHSNTGGGASCKVLKSLYSIALQRYELLWEAGLVEEASSGKRKTAAALGVVMAHDHRRILATAIARLRAKIKYRPVVFELLPNAFTLLQLQTTVEALAGLKLHKQNFRRLVEGQGLVEETGAMTRGASGRPAKLFAFRREVLLERAAVGTKLPRSA